MHTHTHGPAKHSVGISSQCFNVNNEPRIINDEHDTVRATAVAGHVHHRPGSGLQRLLTGQ